MGNALEISYLTLKTKLKCLVFTESETAAKQQKNLTRRDLGLVLTPALAGKTGRSARKAFSLVVVAGGI